MEIRGHRFEDYSKSVKIHWVEQPNTNNARQQLFD